MKTIVIGLGNPILSDDSVGIKVSRILKERVFAENDIDVVEIYAGGMRLMDAMVGYERAVIIDAMVTGKLSPGSLQTLPLSALISTRNMTCMHDTNILTALEFGRMLGIKLPEDITVFGIEAKDVETFGEELTSGVSEAVSAVVDRIVNSLLNNLPVRGQI